VYEHHLVWWKRTGKIVPKGHILHHKNESKRDNRFENLELLGAGEHTRHHHIVPPVVLRCYECGKRVEMLPKTYRWKMKTGQKRFFCSRSCSVKTQMRLMWGGGVVSRRAVTSEYAGSIPAPTAIPLV
jgi:hypothetical protein